MLKNIIKQACLLAAMTLALTASAEQKLAVLKAATETYRDVTITEVTATDIYFTHASGIGSAKLKTLDPELQKRFNFDPAKAAQAEKNQVRATAEFRKNLTAQKPAAQPQTTAADEDVVAPKVNARSFRGHRPPPLVVDKWLSPTPDTKNKFVLLEFWATWCGPCRRSIPHLNSLQEKFKNRLVVVGVSNESEQDVRKMTSPKINYTIAIDTKARTAASLEITAIPHAILIDPKGIVRYEGNPGYLNDKGMEQLIRKYGN